MTDKNGKTYREIYEQVEKSTGRENDLLDTGVFPDWLGYLLIWFYELALTRQSNEAGPQPITYTEIVNYQLLSCNIMLKWEVKVIKQMDAIFLNVFSENQRKNYK